MPWDGKIETLRAWANGARQNHHIGFAECLEGAAERIAVLTKDKEDIRVEWERCRDRELTLEAENERLRAAAERAYSLVSQVMADLHTGGYTEMRHRITSSLEVLDEARAALAGGKQ